jgi:hypothetical protein
MKFNLDINIGFADRKQALAVLSTIPTSIIKDKSILKEAGL